MRKKLMGKLSGLLVFVLMFGFISTQSVHAQGASNLIQELGQYTIQTLDSSDTYEKLKITNNETGEIEYLESFISDNEAKYVVTSDDNILVVMSTEKSVSIFENNILIDQYDKDINYKDGSSTVAPMAYGNWGSWTYTTTSRSAIIGGITTVAAILAAGAGGALAGFKASAFISIASYMISLGITEVWYIIGNRMRWDFDNQMYETHRRVWMYEHSNFTGLIGETESYQTTYYD